MLECVCVGDYTYNCVYVSSSPQLNNVIVIIKQTLPARDEFDSNSSTNNN